MILYPLARSLRFQVLTRDFLFFYLALLFVLLPLPLLADEPLVDSPAQKKEPGNEEKKTNTTAAKKLNLNFVPDNALAVLAMKPQEIMAQDLIKPYREQLLEDVDSQFLDVIGIKFAGIEATRFFYLASTSGNPEEVSAAYIIQTKTQIDQSRIFKTSIKDGYTVDTLSYKQSTYFGGSKKDKKERTILAYWMFPDDYTFIVTTGKNSMHDFIDAMRRGKNHQWKKQWDVIENNSVAAIIDFQKTRKMYQEIYSKMSPEDQLAALASMGIPPSSLVMLEHIEVVSMRATFVNRLAIRATLYQNENGDVVKKAIDDVVAQWKALFQMEGNGFDPQDPEVLDNLVLYLYTKSLKSIRTARQGENVKIMIAFPDELVKLYLSGLEE